ncbi:protein ABHD11-like [Patiria miniata]|uniref:sn-1-specific diacylglycerol lipase ABHD11 n=1 Tax=Patiria miniata TaxID=46514 RepID=A0A913ZUC0_PATMI|nr:protein ABHD11-like [Patiria miniata]
MGGVMKCLLLGKFGNPWNYPSPFCHGRRLFSRSARTCEKRAVKLAYNVVGPASLTDNSPVVILHGLFGSKSNWATFAKKIHRETQRTIFTVDVRNHGNSEHGDGMGTEAMRDDLLMLMRNELRLDRCILIGHSLGGRIAMVTALSKPHLIDKLVVVDVSPVPTGSAFQIPEFIAAMKAVEFDQSVSLAQNRKNAGKQLQAVIKDVGLLQFILTNVTERDGVCQWRLNLDGLEAGIPDLHADLPTFNNTYDGPVVFIRGSRSNYIRMDHLPAMKKLFPTATIATVEGAGHFVHSEKPREFLETVAPFLRS